MFDYFGHARDNSVYFSWGPYYRRKFEHEGWIVEQLVYCGHVWHTGISVSSIGEHRERLLERGAERVVCFFDNTYGPNCQHSQQMIVGLYVCLLAEVVRDVRFGLLIKPKDSAALEALSEVQELLVRAEATGRCIVLNGRISPADVAAAADVVIGAGFNTAVVQAVTSGRPGLHADLSGHKDNDFHTWGGGLVAFTDLDSLMAGMRKCLAEGVGSSIGDHTPVIKQIDPFCDGGGARRMGRYLYTYMKGINSGAGRNESLARAKADYQAQFGVDNVEAVLPGYQPIN